MSDDKLRSLSFDVRGLPRAQGSMLTHKLPNGMTASRYPPAVWEWRHQVQQQAAQAAEFKRFTGPVHVGLVFDLPRPQSHYRTGKHAGELKASAPNWPNGRPDIDKLSRCCLDAITDSGLWRDDSQVSSIHVVKHFGDTPGVRISISELDQL